MTTVSAPRFAEQRSNVLRMARDRFRVPAQVVFVIVILGTAWELLSRAETINPKLFSSPSRIWDTWWVLLERDLIWPHLWETTRELGLALLLFTVVAGILGVILGLNQYTFEVFYGPIATLFAFPKVTLYPVVIAAFGLGLESKIVFGAIFGFFPLVMNTMVGVRAVRALHLDLFASLGMGQVHRFFKLLLPATLPSFVTGLRIGYVYAGIGVLLAEMFAAVRGLGNRIIAAGYQSTLDAFWVYVVLASLLLLVGAGALRVTELKLSRWRT